VTAAPFGGDPAQGVRAGLVRGAEGDPDYPKASTADARIMRRRVATPRRFSPRKAEPPKDRAPPEPRDPKRRTEATKIRRDHAIASRRNRAA